MGFDSFTSLFSSTPLLHSGGPVVSILLVLSLIALTVVLVKLWQLFPYGLGSGRLLDAVFTAWSSGDQETALRQARGSRQPVFRVLAAAMAGLSAGAPEARVREESLRVAAEELEGQFRYLRILEVIASLSPLLGLFGTVLGMIEAFQALESAGHQANPAVLSGGIWQALLTTAAGLAVAIPVAAILSLFEGSIHRQRHQMEDALTRVVLDGHPVAGLAP